MRLLLGTPGLEIEGGYLDIIVRGRAFAVDHMLLCWQLECDAQVGRRVHPGHNAPGYSTGSWATGVQYSASLKKSRCRLHAVVTWYQWS